MSEAAPGMRRNGIGRLPPLARLVGRRPEQGAGIAAKQVAQDVSTLLRAEIQLAKAEVADAVKSKAQGVALFVGAAVLGWLAIQALLITLGFALALFLPGWLAALLVTLLLLVGAGIAGLIGKRRLEAQLSLEQTKDSVAADQAVARQAVEQAQANTREGIAEAKEVVISTAQDVKARLSPSRNGDRPEPTDEAAATAPDVPPGDTLTE